MSSGARKLCPPGSPVESFTATLPAGRAPRASKAACPSGLMSRVKYTVAGAASKPADAPGAASAGAEPAACRGSDPVAADPAGAAPPSAVQPAASTAPKPAVAPLIRERK